VKKVKKKEKERKKVETTNAHKLFWESGAVQNKQWKLSCVLISFYSVKKLTAKHFISIMLGQNYSFN
jgi:hypothetical protein